MEYAVYSEGVAACPGQLSPRTRHHLQSHGRHPRRRCCHHCLRPHFVIRVIIIAVTVVVAVTKVAVVVVGAVVVASCYLRCLLGL